MKPNARNQLPGRVTASRPGAVDGSVKVALGDGPIVTASIAEDAVAGPAPGEGDRAGVAIEASGVMIGK